MICFLKNRLVNLIEFFMIFYQTKNKMSFSWKELVCHGLLDKVGDPSLVKDLLKMVMKERWLFLEEEAREFHSENVAAAPDRAAGWRQLEWRRQELRHQINACDRPKLPSQLIQKCLETDAAISRRKLMDELLSSWKERIPEQRRRAVMMHKESKLLRWRGHGDYDITSGRARDLDSDYHSIENSIKWYGEIHEGRYYLFWDQRLALPIEDCAKRRRQSKAFLMSGFDINIIDGEGLNKNISDSWVYAYEQWTKNPGGWGTRQFEFTMVHSIGKKEKMHIDDMFLKE